MSPTSPPDPRPLLAGRRVMPILTVEGPRDAVLSARALAAGGLPVMEITLRTPGALDAIRAVVAEVDGVTCGAGTIRSAADIERARAAGAAFLVTPGTPPRLAEALAECELPALPGCATASEAMALAERGFPLLKLFPAEPAGGVAFLKAVAAPLPDLLFCPTGGVTTANAGAYLALPTVPCVGGSWVAPKALALAGDAAAIERLAREAAAV